MNSNSLEDFLDAIEGLQAPNYGTNEALRCDYCNEPINPNTEVTVYVSNWDLSGIDESSGFGLQRLYGQCCNRRRIKFPCHGCTEMILEGMYTRQKTLKNWEPLHISPSDDGEMWDPIEVHNEVMPASYEEHQSLHTAMKGQPQQQGPEDIVDHLHHLGVDIREIVNKDGEIVIDAEKEKEIKQKMDKRAEELMEKYKDEGLPI